MKTGGLFKLKCLIIDDEPDAVKVVEKILTDFCADKTEIAGTTTSSVEGIKLVHKINPDLVFLDIEMPGVSGFDLIDIHTKPQFKVIFVTAYDKHALRAIKYKPDGYLLKPLDIGELVQAVNTVYEEILNSGNHHPVTGKYSISVKDETVLVDFADIIYVKANGRYSDFHLTGNRAMTVCRNIGNIEKELTKKGFIRCHKSYLVNHLHITRFNKTDGGFIEISNGTSIEISRRKRNVLFG